MTTHARGDLSEANRLPVPDSAEPWWDYLAVAMKDWEKATVLLPDSITHLLRPMLFDAAVRFRNADFASTASGRAIRKRMTAERIPLPSRGVADLTIRTVLRTWAGGPPLKLGRDLYDAYLPITAFVATALHEGRPLTLLSTPTHRFGWIDPVVFVERVLRCKDVTTEICDSDWAIALLRLSFHRRADALALWKGSHRGNDAVNSYVQVALNNEFQPGNAIGDPRILVAAMRARSRDCVIAKEWPWARDLQGHSSHDPVDFVWKFTPTIDPAYPKVEMDIIDHCGLSGRVVPRAIEHFDAVMVPESEVWQELGSFVQILRYCAESSARDVERHMPENALPPVSLYRGLTCGGELGTDGPGIPPQSGTMLSIWPASPDIFWTRWAMYALQRDVNRFANMNLPAYCLEPLKQLDQPVTHTAIRWLWIGWNNRCEPLHEAVVDHTIRLLGEGRLNADAVVDVFDSMNPCDWWHPGRLRQAFWKMIDLAPDSANFFGTVATRCVASFPSNTRGLKQFTKAGQEWLS